MVYQVLLIVYPDNWHILKLNKNMDHHPAIFLKKSYAVDDAGER